MKKKISLTLTAILAVTVFQATAEDDPLRLDPSAYTIRSMKMPDGETITFKAYEGIRYVTEVEDSAYQTLNFYYPAKIGDNANVPILLRTYIGGYMASAASGPSATDATGRALQEGLAVCIPGSRGSNSTVTGETGTIYTGIAPNGILDLKAAIRWLRYNDDILPGDAEHIFIDGTSAGGAMAALAGATGNSHEYEALLIEMGAAPARDNVFASICYCPITDLEHADMAYEWLYGFTNDKTRNLDEEHKAISRKLSGLYPEYLNSLNLTDASGKKLTADNYREYLKSFLMESAHKALQEGAEIPDSIGVIFFSDGRMPLTGRPGGRQARNNGSAPRTDFVTDIDLDTYLAYVASVTPLKTPPAFDHTGVADGFPSPENKVFGNIHGEPDNFTAFGPHYSTGDPKAILSPEMQLRVYMMNPMNFLDPSKESDIAPHWYIRHGAADRDTSFPIPVNLATKLMNLGLDVDFALPWNRPHSGDYNLDDLFSWIKKVMENEQL